MAESERRLELAAAIDEVITPGLLLHDLANLQGPAPSGTVLYTRTPVLQEIVGEIGLEEHQFTSTFLDNDSPAVLMDRRKDLVFDAHSDTISYIPPKSSDDFIDISPNCAYRPTEANEHPASVMRFKQDGKYEFVSEGVIGSHKDSPPYYRGLHPEGGFMPGIDRVVYKPELKFDWRSRIIRGNIDNAGGLAVCLAAIKGLKSLVGRNSFRNLDELNVGFIFPDEEEGLPIENGTFARGARRIALHSLHRLMTPSEVVIVDGHDIKDLPPYATFAGFVSAGKGAVVPPTTYAKYYQLFNDLEEYGVIVKTTEDGSDSSCRSISRSDDPAWMEVTSNVIPVGYPEWDPHFNDGPPSTNIDALVDNAKALTYIALSHAGIF